MATTTERTTLEAQIDDATAALDETGVRAEVTGVYVGNTNPGVMFLLDNSIEVLCGPGNEMASKNLTSIFRRWGIHTDDHAKVAEAFDNLAALIAPAPDDSQSAAAYIAGIRSRFEYLTR